MFVLLVVVCQQAGSRPAGETGRQGAGRQAGREQTDSSRDRYRETLVETVREDFEQAIQFSIKASRIAGKLVWFAWVWFATLGFPFH